MSAVSCRVYRLLVRPDTLDVYNSLETNGLTSNSIEIFPDVTVTIGLCLSRFVCFAAPLCICFVLLLYIFNTSFVILAFFR
jgi:hypothetical protein